MPFSIFHKIRSICFWSDCKPHCWTLILVILLNISSFHFPSMTPWLVRLRVRGLIAQKIKWSYQAHVVRKNPPKSPDILDFTFFLKKTKKKRKNIWWYQIFLLSLQPSIKEISGLTGFDGEMKWYVSMRRLVGYLLNHSEQKINWRK